MRTNVKAAAPVVTTHEGARAYPHMTPMQALRRSVLANLLWEDTFYESGESIADRIVQLAASVSPADLAALAVEARTQFNLRHAPLLLAVALAKHGKGRVVGDAIAATLQRADELAEFLSIYWRNGRCPLSKQVKRGLAMAFEKFTAYDLAKYNRDDGIKLRDVAFMVHAKPRKEERAGPSAKTAAVVNGSYKRGETERHPEATLTKLIMGTLPAPDTWEVSLSGGADKRETFERLLREGKLGYLALLRNLRNMVQAGVPESLIAGALLARKGAHRVLPFRYVAAARVVPQLEPQIDIALQAAIAELPELPGKTVVLVDVSGSMDATLSQRSDLKRIDAAAALASIIKGDLRVFTFSHKTVEVPPRRGMAGIDAIIKSQPHGSTELAQAVDYINKNVPHDRLIVITDEQAHPYSGELKPACKHGYMINVAAYQHGVGYGPWTHIDGFSENVIRFIHELEHEETKE